MLFSWFMLTPLIFFPSSCVLWPYQCPNRHLKQGCWTVYTTPLCRLYTWICGMCSHKCNYTGSHYTGRLIGDSTVCAVTIAEQGCIQCRVGAFGFKEKVMQLFSQALSVRYRCVTFVVWETCQMGVLLGPYLVYCVLKKFWYVCRSLHCMRCSLVLLGITGAHRYNFFLCVLVMPSSSKTVVPVV